MARDKWSSAESRKNMGDLLAVEPSLPVTPVTLLPVLFDQSVMSVSHSISLTDSQTINQLIHFIHLVF